MRFVLLCLIAYGLNGVATASAQQPPEKLPPPKLAEELLPDWIVILPPEPRPEHGRLAVWQLYSIDSTGHFRPRVINSPWGAYYLHNLAPYPWRTLESRYYRPMLSP